MRVGVVSDTHWRLRSHITATLLKAMQGVDHILHAGDITRDDVLYALEEIAPLSAVCGNCDGWDLRSILPEKRVVVLDGARVGLIHGWGRDERYLTDLRREFGNIDALVFGHWHRRYNQRRDGILYFNPGSPSSGGAPSVGILEISGSHVEGRHIFLS
jgi:putative phosphoesterase